MVKVEESEPVSLGNVCMTAYRVVLVTDPDYQDHVEGGGGVLEELGHDRFHPDQRQDDSK